LCSLAPRTEITGGPSDERGGRFGATPFAPAGFAAGFFATGFLAAGFLAASRFAGDFFSVVGVRGAIVGEANGASLSGRHAVRDGVR
jgi:hypothetical protein